MYVCLCKGITESEFQRIVERHRGSFEGIKQEMGLEDSCCGRCEDHMRELIQDCPLLER